MIKCLWLNIFIFIHYRVCVFIVKSTCSYFTFTLMYENCLATIEHGVFRHAASVACFFMWLIIMICCEFGHKDIFEDISSRLDEAITQSIKLGCSVFYTGAMGEYDSQFAATVRRAKKTNPKIKLVCVKPYMTKELNENKDYYTAMFDDVLIPNELMGIKRWRIQNEKDYCCRQKSKKSPKMK